MLYHIFHSPDLASAKAKFANGIDPAVSDGHGQGQGFYLWQSKPRAMLHNRFLRSLGATGPCFVAIIEQKPKYPLYELDYEAEGHIVMRYVAQRVDYLRQQSTELEKTGVRINPEHKTITVIDENSRRSVGYFQTTHASGLIRDGQVISTLVSRLKTFNPELIAELHAKHLPHSAAVKYVGPAGLQPSRICAFEDLYMPAASTPEI